MGQTIQLPYRTLQDLERIMVGSDVLKRRFLRSVTKLHPTQDILSRPINGGHWDYSLSYKPTGLVRSLRYIHAAADDRIGRSLRIGLSFEQISIPHGNTLMSHKSYGGASPGTSNGLVVGPTSLHRSPASRYIDTQHISASRREMAVRTHLKHISRQKVLNGLC